MEYDEASLDHAFELMEEWRRRLRLSDWELSLEISRYWELENPGAMAEVVISLPSKHGYIHLLDPQDWRPEMEQAYALEVSIVHELLEIHFAPFKVDDGSWDNLHQEQVIELMAQSFVDFKHSEERDGRHAHQSVG